MYTYKPERSLWGKLLYGYCSYIRMACFLQLLYSGLNNLKNPYALFIPICTYCYTNRVSFPNEILVEIVIAVFLK